MSIFALQPVLRSAVRRKRGNKEKELNRDSKSAIIDHVSVSDFSRSSRRFQGVARGA